MTDLTQLDRPLGEYPDEVIGALVRAWQSGAALQYRLGDGGDWKEAVHPFFHLDYAYRLAPEPLRPMSPPWDVLPEWVQAVVFDEDGVTTGFECRDNGQRLIDLSDFRFDRGNMPWRESLVLRPEGV